MKYTRVFSDEQGESKFEEIIIDLKDHGAIGWLSDTYKVRELQFRRNQADYNWDFHNAPAKQFIILLDGEIAITTSTGETRNFKGGDILLMEDTNGKGHKTRNIKAQIRQSIFIKI